MGQVLQRLYSLEQQECHGLAQLKGKGSKTSSCQQDCFPDLCELPPELGLTVLSYLNPTDLCLAACVWEHLANDQHLWYGYVSLIKMESN